MAFLIHSVVGGENNDSSHMHWLLSTASYGCDAVVLDNSVRIWLAFLAKNVANLSTKSDFK